MTKEMQDLCDRYLICDKLSKECGLVMDTAQKNGHEVVKKYLLMKSIGFSSEMTEIEKKLRKLHVA